MNRKLLFGAAAGMLLVVFVLAALLFQKYHSASPELASASGVWQRDGAPVKGPPDAKVTIVEFFDPACGTCREFYPLVAKLIEQYPGKVRVMMRYAPLHPGSDKVVAMLEAARLQGKYWEALERLFAGQNRWVVNHTSQPEKALALMEVLNLDAKRLAADMNSPSVVQVVQQDVRDGQTLNVRATPEFFVNGRPLPRFGFDQLSLLVQEAVAKAY
ncbi:MAG: thioredoxin domain-containing protein [Magnetococcales bacterium]|nr:thioredoxin domain-containing protein [Magnetococcales bacterium]